MNLSDTVILASVPLVRPLAPPWAQLKANLIQTQFLSLSEPSSAIGAQKSREDILVVLQGVNTQVGGSPCPCPLPNCPDQTHQALLSVWTRSFLPRPETAQLRPQTAIF